MDLVYNLVNAVDEEETERKIEEYKQANRNSIVLQQTRRGDELRSLASLVELEKQQAQALHRSMQVILFTMYVSCVV